MDGRLKILLADDSSTVRAVVQLALPSESFDVLCVADGEQAIQALQELRPDLVIADVVMPKKDGYELCAFIRATPELIEIPVLLLSGAFETFDAGRAAQAGADAHLVKPFEPGALIDKIRKLTGRAEAGGAAGE
jgi:CheY-like chemotaxis protein